MDADAVIVGAGAAGLAAAARLGAAGLQAKVVEARNRIGGRIATYRPPDAGPPLELGAQVVHGDRNPIWRLIGRGSARELPRRTARTMVRDKAEPFRALGAAGHPPWTLEDRLAAARPDDVPVAKWLAAEGIAAEPAEEWFRQHWAAEPDLLSARGVAIGRGRERAVGGGQQVIEGGFDLLTARLAAGLDVRCGAPVREVSWSPGRVHVRTDDDLITAAAVIVTVPPPLVVAGTPAINDLPVRKLAAAAQLRLGDGWCAVVTMSRPAPAGAVVFDADGRAGFVHCTADRPEVLIVAKARAAQAMRTAARFGGLADELRRALPWTQDTEVVSTKAADWGADEWSGGAFTFPKAGALWAPQAWAQPLEGTVFFAGEATAGGAPMVHQAVASGQRAAVQLLEARSQ